MTDSPALAPRPWIPEQSEALIQRVASSVRSASPAGVVLGLEALASTNSEIHDMACVNLNPATNTMNPRAEALLSTGLGTRPSLGYPGAKYEMGLEAIEHIEITVAELAAEVFDAPYVELRVPSGAMANLYAFMACAQPGDSMIAPPASIAGHVTHHEPGCAGLYGLEVHEAPIDPRDYTIDVARLATMAREVKPKLISVGGSLNLDHHDVAGVRAVADEVGATVLFDAAHLSGLIAGGAWPNPLHEGAHIMTMSTYKSLGGPPAGLLVTTSAEIAERVEQIAFPGMTANFDAANTAALGVTLADWLAHGTDYGRAMVEAAHALADELAERSVDVHRTPSGFTRSHAFALRAGSWGGHNTAGHLRQANILTSAIGLPTGLDDGVRIGTNEIVRWGARADDMGELAELVSLALVHEDPKSMRDEVTKFRRRFDTINFVLS
ncbi:MAG: serine hydroxymethyltransferase [Acidimicrobiales bacterium]|nr:serine hydroxymethyltransferase [Acidimicrobiales bacterium]RZV48596.1 MAG: serine hydroxymethyltransferase [Acidimicrobiales bacterium]